MMSQATSAVANTDSKDLLIVGTVLLPELKCQKEIQQARAKVLADTLQASSRRRLISISGMQGLVS